MGNSLSDNIPPQHKAPSNSANNQRNNPPNNQTQLSSLSTIRESIRRVFVREEELPDLRELYAKLPEEILMIEIFSFLPLTELPKLLILSEDFHKRLMRKNALFTRYCVRIDPIILLKKKNATYEDLKSAVEFKRKMEEMQNILKETETILKQQALQVH